MHVLGHSKEVEELLCKEEHSIQQEGEHGKQQVAELVPACKYMDGDSTSDSWPQVERIED